MRKTSFDYNKLFTAYRGCPAVIAVILIGLFFRLYSFHFDPVVNPDGTLYIQQAKALNYGFTNSLTECYFYVSSYPFLIAFFYKVIGHWVTAASSVSIAFSMMTLLPLYLLLRQFLDKPQSIITLLILAIMPRFVGHSHEVIRDPVFWFFAALGLYLFVRQIQGKKKLYLILSSLSFILATWARVEGLLFILVSFVFLVFSSKSGKGQRLLYFVSPIMVLGLLVIGYATFFQRDILRIIPFQALMARLRGFGVSYHNLQENLIALENQWIPGFSPYFFETTRSLVWLIAIGAVLRQILRTFSYPFFFIFVIGLFGLREKLSKDTRLVYLAFLSAGAIGVLWVQVIYNWAVHSRHVALFLIPSLVFMGFGVVKTSKFVAAHLKWNASVVNGALFMAVLLLVLPLNLKTGRGANKLVWREIGRFISAQEKGERAVEVGGGFKRINLVHYYANENVRGAPCFHHDSWLREKELTPDLLLQKGLDYYLWDEKTGSRRLLETIEENFPGDFVEVGRWKSPKKGQVILFRITSSNGVRPLARPSLG